MQKLWHCLHRRASLSIQEVQGKGMWECADLQLLDELGLLVGAHGGQGDAGEGAVLRGPQDTTQSHWQPCMTW